MKFEEFALKSREEALRFEELLATWQDSREGVSLPYIPLSAAWDVAQSHPEPGRLFSAVLDLRLNLALLPVDLSTITEVLNKDLHKERKPSDSILTDQEHFFERMDLLHACLDYILRFRAVLDKVMGLLILLAAPSEYQRFSKADSRRSEFERIAEETGAVPEKLVANLGALVAEFDNRYRTAEAHGAGRMRKFSLVVQIEEYNPSEMLVWAWNNLNDVVQMLTKYFEVASAQRPDA